MQLVRAITTNEGIPSAIIIATIHSVITIATIQVIIAITTM
jgi:hypothetical protein